MHKIISLFQRDWTGDRLARNEITPGAEWVVEGKGHATRKYDGTSCMIDEDGVFWKRYEVKKGGTQPVDFVAASAVDEITGKQQGWVLVKDGPEDQYHREAFSLGKPYTITEEAGLSPFQPGTYELCGPKVQGNVEGLTKHILLAHGDLVYPNMPRTYQDLKDYFFNCFDLGYYIEGVVWWYYDETNALINMVKCKSKDFGVKMNPVKRAEYLAIRHAKTASPSSNYLDKPSLNQKMGNIFK